MGGRDGRFAPTETDMIRITLRNSSGGVLDEKEGDDIGDLLRDYAADGCLSPGDTLEIEGDED